MATLSDIAEKCGTSTATASYVLNGRGDEKRISKAMQVRILAAARELGYQRSPVIASPAPSKIAIFWPQRNVETMLPAVINGLNSAMLMESVPVSMSICPYETNNLCKQDSLWTAKSYDAAIIVSANSVDLKTLAEKRTKFPAVVHNRILPGYSSVSADHREAGRLAALQAICKGGDDIGLISNPNSFMGLDLRGKAFCDTCAEYGVDVNEHVFCCENSIDDGYELGARLIREKRLPKVIVCLYDIVGYGLIRALNEAGISVGDEVQVLATSTSLPQFFARSTPPMTVVDLHIEEVTRRAVRLAVDLATHRIVSPTEIVIPPQIIYRDSSPVPTAAEQKRLLQKPCGPQ